MVSFRKPALVFICIFVLSILTRGFCQDRRVTHTLHDLTEAISLALKSNRSILSQEKELQASRAIVRESRSVFLPYVGVQAGLTRNEAVLNSGALGAASKKDPGIFSGYKSDNKLSLQASQNLYNGNLNSATLKQAQLNLDVQLQTLKAAKLEVEFEAKRLYYGLLLAYETELIAEDLLDQAQSHYEDVKERLAQGTVSQFELLQSKVQVSKLKPEVIKAQNARDSIGDDLKKLLGLPIRDTLEVEGGLAVDAVAVNEEEFLKTAYLNRPEMVLKNLGIDIRKWSIEQAHAGYRPRVDASAAYNFHSNNPATMFNDRHRNWNAGVSVSIPIFEGFSAQAKVAHAQARYAQAQIEKEDFSQTVAVDVSKGCLDLGRAQAIIEALKDSVAEAREALRIAEVSFASGEGTNLDVLDAQVSLSKIQKDLSESKYDYLMAQAFLDRTMGIRAMKEEADEK